MARGARCNLSKRHMKAHLEFVQIRTTFGFLELKPECSIRPQKVSHIMFRGNRSHDLRTVIPTAKHDGTGRLVGGMGVIISNKLIR